MSENYIKDDHGNFILDRRSNNNMEVQQTLFKLVASVESLKENNQIILKSFEDKLVNLDEKMSDKLVIIQEKMEDNETEHSAIQLKVDAHEISLRNAKKYIDDIKTLQGALIKQRHDINKIQDDVLCLQRSKMESKASFIDSFLLILKNVAFTTAAGTFVAFILYFIKQYLLVGGSK